MAHGGPSGRKGEIRFFGNITTAVIGFETEANRKTVRVVTGI